MSFEEFITQTNHASSQEEVFALFQEKLRNLGYDSVVYSLLTDHPSIGRKAGHGVMGNYPTDWMELLHGERVFRKRSDSKACLHDHSRLHLGPCG